MTPPLQLLLSPKGTQAVRSQCQLPRAPLKCGGQGACCTEGNTGVGQRAGRAWPVFWVCFSGLKGTVWLEDRA